MKKHFWHLMLLLVTPIALYFNFFIADKYLWKMDIKAWVYYSLAITVSKIFVIIVCNYLIYKLLTKQKIWTIEKINKYNNLTITSFLLSNFYFLFPLHQYLWLYVPIFSFTTILIIGYIFFRMENGDKITLKYIFYVKKSDVNEKYNTKILAITGLLYLLFYGIVQWIILQYIYNPYRESLQLLLGDDVKITW